MSVAGTTTVQRLRLRLLGPAPALVSAGVRTRARAPARATTAGADTTRAQQVVKGWLAGLEPGRYGLPAQAIVVVRRMHTGLPALVPGSPWPDPLAALLRSAARPANASFVGAAAAAVWFSDEAELLACLARDTKIGQPTWWWPLLLGRQPDAALAVARWCRGPQHMPRAMQQLGAGEGRAWLQGLGATARGALLRAVSGAFPVCAEVQAEVQAEVAGAEDNGAALPDDGPTDTGSAARADGRGVQFGAGAGAGADQAAVAARRLHELLQALARDAMAASTPRRFVPAGRDAAPPAGAPPAQVPKTDADARQGATQRVPSGSSSLTQGSRAAASRGRVAAPLAGPVASAIPAAGAPARDFAPLPAAPPVPPTGTAEEAAMAATAWLEDMTQAHGAPLSAPPARPLHTEAPVAIETQLDTELGGLFFLLNMALALGLYGDFTQPRRLGLALTPWQFLHAAAHAWARRAYHADALRPWLQAQADTRPWPAGGTLPGAGLRRPPGPLADLAPMLRARLAQALGLTSPRQAVALTLRLRARLQARPGRVDLHFDLAALPLALRLAGLDRDPGWIPAAGCDFRFHFH